MRTALSVLSLFLLALLAPHSSQAVTWIVNAGGTGAFPTIQAAIDDAQVVAGDVIALVDGTYTGAGNRDLDYGGKAITIRSLSGEASACVIDCNGSAGDPHFGVRFQSGEGAGSTLQDVTITRAFSDLAHLGAIECLGSAPSIIGCTISETDLAPAGASVAAVYSNDGSPSITDCVLEGLVDGPLALFGLDLQGGDPIVTGCTVKRFRLGLYARDNVSVTVTDCAFDASTMSIAGTSATLVYVRRCVSDGLGMAVQGAAYAEVTDCLVTNADGTGISVANVANARVIDCVMTGATETGFYGTECGVLRVERATICGNTGDIAGGVFLSGGAQTMNLTLLDCVITGNYGTTWPGAGGVFALNGPLVVEGCTIAGNRGTSAGGGLTLVGPTEIARSIVWGNCTAASGDEIWVDGAVTYTCSDIGLAGVYVNSGSFVDEGDNIDTDPLFGDALDCTAAPDASGDYRPRPGSPCTAASSPCGSRIGALGPLGPAPSLIAVSDVGNDQGRKVRLEWYRSSHDEAGDTVCVTSYAIYRLQDTYRMPGGWDFVMQVPAHGSEVYQTIAPTLCDSTDVGVCWSTFLVRAETADPFTYFDSAPDSGYSTDDLAPEMPANLHFVVPAVLAWNEAEEEDFEHHTIYGSTNVTLENAVLIGYTAETTYDVSTARHDYYLVTTTDHAGNEGPPAAIIDPSTVETPDGTLPAASALRASGPNPFAAKTSLHLDLAKPGHVRLSVFDAGGRRVCGLLNDHLPAGRYVVSWDARNDAGAAVVAGVYFVRARAHGLDASQRLVLVR